MSKPPEKVSRNGETYVFAFSEVAGSLYTRLKDGEVIGWIVIRNRSWERADNKLGVEAGDFRFPKPCEFGISAWNYLRDERDKAVKKLRSLSIHRR